MSQSKVELLHKYLGVFEKNPQSKVFAPLAEIHRSFGDIDEALKVLEVGFHHHPQYTLARIVLGRCYFDQGKFDLALTAVSEVAMQEEDNLTLQLLYARILDKLDRKVEALKVYKLVLFLNARDEEAKAYIENYEDTLLLEAQNPTHTDEQTLFEVPIDDWVSVDFTRDEIQMDEEEGSTILKRFRSEVKEQKLDVSAANLEGSFLKQDFDFEEGDVLPQNYSLSEGIESIKLVDLYCAQGSFEKAFELLGRILDKSPNDQGLLKYYEELKIVLSKNLDCTSLYLLKLKLKQFLTRIKEIHYENSYY